MSNTITNPPPRIYNWLNGQLSLARFAGSISINGVTYVVATHEDGQPLVRQDVLAAEAVKAAKAAKAEREKWAKAQQSFAEFSNA